MAKKITIAKIAERCGVSIATVSRVLNGGGNVRPALRRKIMDYIDDAGWEGARIQRRPIPSTVRRAVIICSSKILEKADPEFPRILDILRSSGYLPLVVFGHRAESLKQCLFEKPDLVLVYSLNDLILTEITLLQSAGIRVIALGDVFTPVCPTISGDHRAAVRDAAKRFAAAGKTKIGLFAGFGESPHPESMEKIPFRRVLDMAQGIRDVFPKFDPARDAVSDSFGNLSELSSMLFSKRYDAWIVSDHAQVHEFFRAAAELPGLPPSTAAFLPNRSCSVPPMCSLVYVQDMEGRGNALKNLLDATELSSNSEYRIPYHLFTGV